jgi:uncharacterized Zn finger protein (UPF0148 family)
VNAPLRTDLKLCPECDEPKLSAADGVLHCTSCGWSEEDDEPMDDATRYALGAM